MKLRKIISLFTAALLIMLCTVPAPAAESKEASTQIRVQIRVGEQLYATYDSSTKTVVVSGNGEMYENLNNNSTWVRWGSIVEDLIINGVLRIPARTFFGWDHLKNVSINEKPGWRSCYIDEAAFGNCSALLNIRLYNCRYVIGKRAFYTEKGFNCKTVNFYLINSSAIELFGFGEILRSSEGINTLSGQILTVRCYGYPGGTLEAYCRAYGYGFYPLP